MDGERDGKTMKLSSISYNTLTETVESNIIPSYDHKRKILSLVKVISFVLLLLFVFCTVIFSYVFAIRIESDVNDLKTQFSEHNDDQRRSVFQLSQKSSHLAGVNENMSSFSDLIDDQKQRISHFDEVMNEQKQSISHFDDVMNEQKQSISHFDDVMNEQKQSISHFNDVMNEQKQIFSNFSASMDEQKQKILNSANLLDNQIGVTHLCSNLAKCEMTDKLDHLYHCYKFISEKINWASAVRKCKALHNDGFLAEILYNAPLIYLNGIISSRTPLTDWWLGASDKEHEGKWIWQHSGKLVKDYVQHWAKGEPNNHDGREHYLQTSKYYTTQWFDATDGKVCPYICEYFSDDKCEEGYRCDDC